MVSVKELIERADADLIAITNILHSWHIKLGLTIFQPFLNVEDRKRIKSELSDAITAAKRSFRTIENESQTGGLMIDLQDLENAKMVEKGKDDKNRQILNNLDHEICRVKNTILANEIAVVTRILGFYNSWEKKITKENVLSIGKIREVIIDTHHIGEEYRQSLLTQQVSELKRLNEHDTHLKQKVRTFKIDYEEMINKVSEAVIQRMDSRENQKLQEGRQQEEIQPTSFLQKFVR